MKIFKSESSVIFLIVFILAAMAGFYLNFKINLIFGDALVRSFHAYLVFFGNEPKLSSIGFVWPPLQTILQLPLVLIPPLNINGFAGNITSAIFFGITAIYINKLAVFFNVNRLLRYIVLVLFIFNPLVFFYGINGMSEIIGISFVVMTLYYLLVHISSHSIPSLVLASIALCCAVMTRWESGTLLFVVLLIVALIPHVNNKRYSFREVESSMVMFLIPIFFVIFLWLMASWLIVGSPTYFLGSTYSFTDHDAKQLAGSALLDQTKGNIGKSLMFAAERVFYLAPLFIPLFMLVLLKLKNAAHRMSALAILGFASCILLAHVLLVFTGKSYGELRYFIYSIPFCYIFMLFLFKDTLTLSLRKHAGLLLISIVTLSLTFSSELTFYAMSLPKYGNQEHVLVDILLGYHDANISYTFDKERRIAEYITANFQTRSILVDDSVGFIIIYFSQKPQLFIETVDSDFQATVDDPVNSQAKYILISNANVHSGVDVLDIVYPTMYASGGEFVALEKDFGDWKLYKILKPQEKITNN